MTAPDTATFAAFARLLGCKPSAVTALRHAGRLVLTDNGKRVHVQASIQRIEATRDPSKAGVAARHAAARGAALATTAGQGDAAAQTRPPATSQPDDDVDAPAGPLDADYQSSRARREHYQALEAQRAYEVAIGKLMDACEVAAAVSGAVTELRASLERLPDVLGPQLAAIHDEGEARGVLAEAVEHALEEVSRRFYNLAKVAE